MSKRKRTISILILVGLVFLAGMYFERGTATTKPIPTDSIYVMPKHIIIENVLRIDSLENEISKREGLITSLQDSISSNVKVRLEKLEEIKQLPLDKGVELLIKNLKEYEDIY